MEKGEFKMKSANILFFPSMFCYIVLADLSMKMVDIRMKSRVLWFIRVRFSLQSSPHLILRHLGFSSSSRK